MKFGLSEHTVEIFNLVFAGFPEIEEVILYGSRAKGNYREGSDITLKGDKVNDRIRSEVFWRLDELNTSYLIDLSVFHFLDSDSLIDHINRVGKTFYVKDKKSVIME